MTNEQLDTIALELAREVGEYSLLNYHDTFKLFARRLLDEVAKHQEPVAWFDPCHGLPYGWTEEPPTSNAVFLYKALEL